MRFDEKKVKDYYSNKTVLITGGLGFLGSTIAHKLVEFNARVIVIDNLNPLYGGNSFNVEGIRDKIEIVTGDILDIHTMKPLIEQAHVIFHLAAQVSYIDSLSMPYHDMDLNARSTLQILEICRTLKVKPKIAFSSSRMVLGKVVESKMTEQSPTNPLSLYGIHKLMSEKYLLMYYNDFGIPSTIYRITNPYGPRQQIKHSKYSLVGWFVRQAMEDKAINIFGEGRQTRDYIFVDDIINGMIIATAYSESDGQILNMGSGQTTMFKDMVEKIIRIVGKGKIVFTPWPANYERIETGDAVADISKIQSISGFTPNVNIDDGIRMTYEYYKINLQKYIS